MMVSPIPVRPVRFVFHMKHDCPICKAIDIHLAKPLETIGVAWFQRVFVSFDRGGMNFSENRLIHGGDKIQAPIIALYETGSYRIRVKYFGIPKGDDIMKGVAMLSKSIIEEISRLRNIDAERIYSSHPLLSMLREVVS